MSNYFKNGLKVFFDYCISLIIFVIFLYVFLGLTKDNYSFWIPLYSFINFLLLFSILYGDIKKVAMKEKRPQYDLKPYPMKGLFIGLIGFLPFFLLQLIYPLIIFNDPIYNRVKELVLKTLLGPVYFVVRLFGVTTLGYVVASLLIPIVSMLAYMAGYYGFELKKKKFQSAEVKSK